MDRNTGSWVKIKFENTGALTHAPLWSGSRIGLPALRRSQLCVLLVGPVCPYDVESILLVVELLQKLD